MNGDAAVEEVTAVLLSADRLLRDPGSERSPIYLQSPAATKAAQ